MKPKQTKGEANLAKQTWAKKRLRAEARTTHHKTPNKDTAKETKQQ